MIKDIKARIIKRHTLSDDIVEFELKPQEPVKFLPGQYVMIKVPIGEKYQYRAYSIANHPEEKSGEIVRIVAKILSGGQGSVYLNTKKENDEIEFRGGLGFFTFKSPAVENIYFICTGTGLIPLLSMIEDQLASGSRSNFILVWGNRFEKDIFWSDLLDELQERHPNFSYELVLSKPTEEWLGSTGYVTDYTKNSGFDFTAGHFYVCGLPQMVEDMKKIFTEKGVTKDRLFEEKFVSVGKSQHS